MAGGRAPRVIVVGGGAAGLAAAARLARRGLHVTLLEARERLGGRIDTRSDPVPGIAIEAGAEFVHGRPAATLALARRARAPLRRVPDRHRVAGGRGRDTAEPGGAGDLLSHVGEGREGETVRAALARALARGGPRDRAAAVLTEQYVKGFYLADPRTASARAIAGMERGMDEIGGGAAARVEGGYARLLEPLASDVRRRGGELRLGTRVESVRWRPGGVEVRARGRAGGGLPPLAAARLVLTLPVPLLRAGGVRFAPALPGVAAAAAALEMGPIVKVLLRFRRAPWPAGPRAPVFLHVPGAAVPVFWTLAPFEAPVLVGWAGGPDALPLAGRPEREVVRAALRSAARALGRSPAALEEVLDGALVADWTADPHAGGGYAVFTARSGDAARVLARPVAGTVFLAGEASAGPSAGTVDGALQSGERAADELLASLRDGPAR